jgi:hypothetical protein
MAMLGGACAMSRLPSSSHSTKHSLDNADADAEGSRSLLLPNALSGTPRRGASWRDHAPAQPVGQHPDLIEPGYGGDMYYMVHALRNGQSRLSNLLPGRRTRHLVLGISYS